MRNAQAYDIATDCLLLNHDNAVKFFILNGVYLMIRHGVISTMA